MAIFERVNSTIDHYHGDGIVKKEKKKLSFDDNLRIKSILLLLVLKNLVF